MIHFNSIYFSVCRKENRFPIPNYITIKVNYSSMILTELWQTGADSTHEIHYISSIHLLDSFAKFCKYIPFAHLPHLLPTYSAKQLQSTQSVAAAGTSNSCIEFQWHRKYLFPVLLSSLYRWGDNLNKFSIWQRSKLSYLSKLFSWWRENNFQPAVSWRIHGFSSMFYRLLTLWDSLV